MAGKFIDPKAATITAATAQGYVTIGSVTGWYKSAITWINSAAITDSIGTGNGTATTFTGTLSSVPGPSSVAIKDAGTTVATDDGNGLIVGAGVSGTINYSSGAFSVTFAVAPLTGHALTAVYKLASKRCVITEVDASNNKLGLLLRTTEPGQAATYGRSNVSAYNGGTINQDEQLIYNSNETPLA